MPFLPPFSQKSFFNYFSFSAVEIARCPDVIALPDNLLDRVLGFFAAHIPGRSIKKNDLFFPADSQGPAAVDYEFPFLPGIFSRRESRSTIILDFSIALDASSCE